MKPTAMICILLAILIGYQISDAQWSFVKIVYSSPDLPHGLVMDPDGNLWIDQYRFGVRYTSIRAFRPDGTDLPFSPITLLKFGTDPTDSVANGRGIHIDHNGNILFAGQTESSAGTHRGIYRINYKTGAPMTKSENLGSLFPSQPGVDNQGNVYFGTLIPPWKFIVMDSTLKIVATVIDTGKGYPRSSAVSKDGRHFFAEDQHWYSPTGNDGFFDDYKQDTVWQKKWGGSIIETHAWDRDGNLWVSHKAKKTFYAVDTSTWQIIDSIYSNPLDSLIAPGLKANLITQPHGLAFSMDGDTAYVADFVTTGAVKMYVKGAVGVKRDDNGVPQGFELEQNYPNPFNPSTAIRFSLANAGLTSLRVYDMLGREVAELVNESLSPGIYTATFNASHLPSGTYIYTLTSGELRVSKKMLLVK